MPRPRLLFGPYKTPRYRYGSVVMDELHGEAKIVGTSARIPWPVIQRGMGMRVPALYGDLAKAVRREAANAVMHWWGVSIHTITRWRRALGVGRTTEGSTAIHRANYQRHRTKRAAALSIALKSPERAAKIAAARRGKPRPKHVIEALRKANLGRKQSTETRRKRSESHKRRGTRPPAAGVPWSKKEDQLLQKHPAKVVAERTGRSLTAVYMRRVALGLPDGRKSNGHGRKKATS